MQLLLLFDFPAQLVEFKYWIHFIIQPFLILSQIAWRGSRNQQDIIRYTVFSVFLTIVAYLAAELAESILVTYLSLEMRAYHSDNVELSSLKYYLFLSQYYIQFIKSLYFLCSLFSLIFSVIPWLKHPTQELK